MDEKPAYEIYEYEQGNGSCPYRDWLNKLDGSLKFRVQARINRVKHDGNFGKIRNLTNGVSEMKCSFGGGIRIYYGTDGDKVIILLLGGNKKTQERDDINTAIEYFKDYKENQNG